MRCHELYSWRPRGGTKPRSSIHPSQVANIPTANSPALQVLDHVPNGVSDRVLDRVLGEVSDEVPDGGSDCEFSLLHTDHVLDPYKHQTKLNLSQKHCKTSITHT
jgi:hypothetical protein